MSAGLPCLVAIVGFPGGVSTDWLTADERKRFLSLRADDYASIPEK